MKCLRLLIMVVMVAVLVACYHGQDQAEVSVPPVPTSPNAAYQTAFPAPEAVTPEAATPEAAETPTPATFEEVTPEPETITVEPPEATTPTPEEE